MFFRGKSISKKKTKETNAKYSTESKLVDIVQVFFFFVVFRGLCLLRFVLITLPKLTVSLLISMLSNMFYFLYFMFVL